MRTAIYARFSTSLQKDSSIEDQVRICAERAEREGWTVTQVFSDYAISGRVRDRPGLNALLDHIKAGHADQVLAEAIDRLSRDQEDQANLFKRVRHAGARIVTLSEGEVDELQIGFKGTMAALFTKDLADKIRRGQRGRIAVGRTPGGLVYGYRKVVRLDARGEPERGLREIDPVQADVVRRIVGEYLAGDSPLAIARRLNAEGVPSPSGGVWNVTAINGDTVRGSGILCNPIYVGELVYNRTSMVRDPDTRKRVPRANPPDQWQRVEVPELAIVTREQWDAVRARKAAYHGWSFASQKRPRRLLSGLLQCGCCGGTMTVIADGKWGCTNARRSGTCDNRRTIDDSALERRVVDGIRAELLSPERERLAHQAYREDRARLDREMRQAARRRESRAAELERQIGNLVSAIAAGAGDVPEIVSRLQAARAERDELSSATNDDQAARVVALHPSFGKAYRAAIEQLTTVLDAGTTEGRDGRNALRSLVDRIVLTPRKSARGMDVEIEGRLAAMMDLASGRPTRPREGTVPMVAEERCALNRTLTRIRV